MKNPMEMTGRLIMVTGGSTGIGRATAILLSQLGARVIVVGRDRERLDETLGLLAGEGHLAEEFDFEMVNDIASWVQSVVKRTGPFYGLAHCAGIQYFLPLQVVSADAMESMYRVNTVSAALLVKALTMVGACTKPASFVFISSTAAILGVPANAIYGATKSALMSLCRSLAIELVDRGIRINCVAPGLVETEMVQRSRDIMPPELFDGMVEKHPMGIGQPDDVANGIVFLLADTSRWITGQTLVLDGGLSIP